MNLVDSLMQSFEKQSGLDDNFVKIWDYLNLASVGAIVNLNGHGMVCKHHRRPRAGRPGGPGHL